MAYSSVTGSFEADINLRETLLISPTTNPTYNWTLCFLNVIVYSCHQLSVQINIGKCVHCTESTEKLA